MLNIISIEQGLKSFSEFLPRLILAVVIFLAFWLISLLLRRAVRRFGNTRHLSPDIVKLLGQITEVGLFIFGAITALATLGIDVQAIIAGLGLVGFALGFALKDLLSNFLAGIFILAYSPFERGDTIIVSGNEGMVVEIDLRYTVLRNNEKKILIPNSVLFSNPVTVSRRSGGNVSTENGENKRKTL